MSHHREQGGYHRVMEENEHGNKKEILKNAYLLAQENLISALMILPDRVVDVMSILEDDDFDNTPCRYIYEAMRTMVKNGDGDAINAGTLQSELEHEGHLTSVGGQRKIVSLAEAGILSASRSTIDSYARTVKDISAKNKVKNVMAKVNPMLSPDSGKSAREILEDTQHEFTDVMGNLENVNTSSTVADYFDTFVDKLKERRRTYAETGDALQASGGLPTGFPTLNKLLSGWQKGSMITVGAKNGIGKSISAINFAIAAAQSNASVLFFSMEMTLDEIMTRFVSCDTGISIQKIKEGNLTDGEMERIVNSRDLIKMKIKIDTSQDATVDYIVSSAQKMSQSEAGLDLVIIDYLGLIKYKGTFGADRQNQVREISRSLKEMAMDLQIPVIILVQINDRASNQEEANQEPTKGMIRDSGAIAQDSNVIIILHRKQGENGERRFDIPTKFIVAKNRTGDIGSFLCHSHLWKSQFTEIPKDGDGDFNDDTLSDDKDSDIQEHDDKPSESQPSDSDDGSSVEGDFSTVDFNDDSSDMADLFGE